MNPGYGSAAAYRQALEARLRHDAETSGRDLNWLRRKHVFLRMLHRLAAAQPDVWVLKGGVAVDLRRPGTARTTKDIDLAMRHPQTADPSDPGPMAQLLRTALAVDVDGDLFAFALSEPTRMAEDSYGRPAWRFRVRASLAGRVFTETRIDAIARPEELSGITQIPLGPGVCPPLGAPTRGLLATDLRQQFAEKIHALTRIYGSGESSRIKDLVDLVLLIDDEVPLDAELVRTARQVFAVRGTHEMPDDLGTPPESWREPFHMQAAEFGVVPDDVDAANRIVASAWRQALEHEQREGT